MEDISNFFEMFTGWVAYQLSDNTIPSIFFVCLIIFLLLFLIWAQFKKGDLFDVRAFVCEYKFIGDKGQYVPSTDKGILVGCWLISSYLTIKHYSDVAMGTYLTIWVVNGGFASLSKFHALKILKGEKHDEPIHPA